MTHHIERNGRTRRMATGIALVAFVALAGGMAHGQTAANWTAGSVAGQWTGPANWSTTPYYPDNGQPSAGDVYNVTIGSLADVTLDGDTDAAIALGNLTLGPITQNNPAYLRASGATPTITVNGTFNWNHASLTGTGKIVAKQGINFAPIWYMAHNTSSWNIDIEGNSTYGWYPFGNSDGRNFTNTGTWNIASGVTFNIPGSERPILGGGTINLASGAIWQRDTTNTKTSRIDNVFNNSGTVKLLAGAMTFNGGGTSPASSVYEVASGTTLTLAGGHNVSSTFNWASNANFSFSGGTINSVISTPSLKINNLTAAGGAVFNGPAGAYDPSGNLTVNNGGASFNSKMTVGGNMSVNPASEDGGQVGGTGDIVVNGNLNWLAINGGRVEFTGTGTVTVLGNLVLSSADYARWCRVQSGRTLEIYGNTDYNMYPTDQRNPGDDSSRSSYIFTIDGTLINRSGATWSFVNSSLRPFRGTGTIVNEEGATFQKITGTVERGIVVFGPLAFENAGLVRSTSGPLYFGTAPPNATFGGGSGSFVNTGTVSAEGGGLVRFDGGYTQTSGALLAKTGSTVRFGATGTGNVTIGGGLVGGNGTVDVGTLTMSGGTFSPGESTGTTTVGGNLVLGASSSTLIEGGGTTQGVAVGGYDYINVSGSATLGGTLAVELVGGYQPKYTSQATILTATGGVSGTFAATTLLPADVLNRVRVDYSTPGSVILTDFDLFPIADIVVNALGGGLYEFDGTGSYDPDDDVWNHLDLATFAWTLNGTGIGTTPIVTASLAPGLHVVTLQVTDNETTLGSATLNLVVPEPSSLLLAMLGLAALGLRRGRR